MCVKSNNTYTYLLFLLRVLVLMKMRFLSRWCAEWRWFCRGPVSTPLSLEVSEESAIRSRVARLHVSLPSSRAALRKPRCQLPVGGTSTVFLLRWIAGYVQRHHGISWRLSSYACEPPRGRSPRRTRE